MRRNREAEGGREAGKERARRLRWRCIARGRIMEGADLEGGQGMWCRWVEVGLDRKVPPPRPSLHRKVPPPRPSLHAPRPSSLYRCSPQHAPRSPLSRCYSFLSLLFLKKRTLSLLSFHSPGWHRHAPTACTSSGARSCAECLRNAVRRIERGALSSSRCVRRWAFIVLSRYCIESSLFEVLCSQ